MVPALEMTLFVMIRNQTLVSCKGVAFLSLGVDSSDDCLEIDIAQQQVSRREQDFVALARTLSRRQHNALERTTRTKDADLVICFMLAER